MTRHPPTAVAVIDVGKTHVKLCLVEDATHQPLAVFKRDNRVLASSPYPHFDTDATWRWLLESLADAARKAHIRALVPIAHGASAAVVNDQGLALPIMDYEWAGCESVNADYAPHRDPFTRTLSPALPRGGNVGRQLFWQQTNQPHDFARASAILPYPQYWAWRLTGRLSAEITSVGAHTDLWCPLERRFSDLAVGMGWDKLVPDIVPAWRALGPVASDVATETGLPTECQVYPGLHDSNASYLRYRATRSKPFVVLSTGTWIIFMSSSSAVSVLDERKDMLGNVDAFGDPVPCMRFMGGREYALLAGENGLGHSVQAADVHRIVARRTLAVPTFTQQGGQFTGHEGRIAGPVPESAADRAALASLYAALVCDHALRLLQPRGDIIIEGSFARNAAFCGVLAALQREETVRISNDATGTMEGAALLTRWPPRQAAVDTHPVRSWFVPDLPAYRRAWYEALPQD